MKRTFRRPMLAVAAASVAALTLVSCSSVEEFSEAKRTDLPAVANDELESPVAGSLRLLGEDSKGAVYYAGRWAEDEGEEYCLLIVDAEKWGKSCSPQLPVVGAFQGIRATLSDGHVTAGPTDHDTEFVGPYLTVARP